MNISPKDLKKKFKEEAQKKWRQICKIAKVGAIPFSHEGGIDVSQLSASKKAEIEKIVGATKTKPEPKAQELGMKTQENKGDN